MKKLLSKYDLVLRGPSLDIRYSKIRQHWQIHLSLLQVGLRREGQTGFLLLSFTYIEGYTNLVLCGITLLNKWSK